MDRLAELKRSYLDATPELLPERALLATEAYRNNAGKPRVMQRALALENILRHMTLHVVKGELFLGISSAAPRGPVVCPEFGANWIQEELDLFADREADPIAVSPENKAILKECLSFWQDISIDGVLKDLLPDTAKRFIDHGVITVGGTGTAIGNIAADYPKLLHLGLNGIIAEIDDRIARFAVRQIGDVGKLEFWQSARIACRAVTAFGRRYAEYARSLAETETDADWQRELRVMADILERVPAEPARSFREAMQSLWLIYVVLHIESDPHAILLGRFDQYMIPYYRQDLDSGKISPDQARDLLTCLWIKCTGMIKLRDEKSSKAFAGFPLFQNITIGGVTPDGADATNELSYLMLEAAAEARTSQPSVGLRYHDKIQRDLLTKAAEVIRLGLGYPAIMNDDSIIPKHLIRGATLAEARDYCTNCVETDVPGCTDSRAHSGYVNFPKCLLLALNDGKDMASGEQVGPRTGRLDSFGSFQDLMTAYKHQVLAAVEAIVSAYDIVDAVHAAAAPEPFMSSLLDDCIATGISRQQGGARYNFSGIFGVGLSCAADSLAAVKKLVIEEGRVDRQALLKGMESNFTDAEFLRQTLLKKAPKFGNDDDFVDSLARECASYFARTVTQFPCIRGGFYIPELHSVATHVLFGEMTGATPDGRLAEAPFADGLSPMAGRDRNGPTAAVRSVTKLDHVEMLQGLLYNQKFHPTCLDSSEALQSFVDYLKVFCELGGHHIQFNVVSSENLRQAQEAPLNYRDLVVRVAGYSAYFTELNRRTQNEIINRTELRL
jgi:pyruvate formate-lyase/glycerol dehydratase family glycyl radical enzyme